MPLARARLLTWIAVLCLAPVALSAQVQGKFPPDSFTNLKVLPKNISQRELLDYMRGFTAALGVRCPFCHVGKEGMPLDSFDFASDEKRTKRTARIMLQMVRRIDDSTLMQIPERPTPNVQVSCMTCHRGVNRPMPLPDVLRAALEAGGLDSATRVYRDLRTRYYGRAAYDFGEGTLSEMAIDLARKQRLNDAVGLLDLNAEFFPHSPGVPFARGEAYLAAGDTAQAVTWYQKTLAVDSTFQPARFRLRRLGQGRTR
jgi:Photosynthetic reaction centre cytochrome C subunit